MTDSIEPVAVPASPLESQLKGQLRVIIAAIGGSLALRHVLPAWAVNDQTIDYAVGIVMLGGTAAWSWIRAKLNHAKLYAIADDHRVPAAVAFVQKP